MTEAEINAAIKALKAWFISQDINPKDGGCLMIKLIAELFVSRTRDYNELGEAIGDASKLLALEVAGKIRGWE